MKLNSNLNVGTIIQIIGPVMDISFPPGNMPGIYNSLIIETTNELGEKIKVVSEVQQLLGDNIVRAISMNATDGLRRGIKVFDTGSALNVPVGSNTLGRIFNVLGEPVDQMGNVDYIKTLPIHRSAPSFTNLDTQLSIFETGIKVVDLLAPYRRGGKIGLFGGAGDNVFMFLLLCFFFRFFLLFLYFLFDSIYIFYLKVKILFLILYDLFIYFSIFLKLYTFNLFVQFI